MTAGACGAHTPASSRKRALAELAAIFLRLGTTAFGGPAAHIAMLEDEVVRRRRWLGHERFLDMLGATNLIPGPNSTEMAIHVGYDRAGYAGVVVAGLCFILPATLITGVVAWLYVRFGALPEAAAFLYGVKPAIIAVVLQAAWRLGRSALRALSSVLAAAIALAAAALGVHELVALLGSGVALAAARWLRTRREGGGSSTFAVGLLPLGAAAGVATPAAVLSLGALFLFFLKVGAVLFGSGYVLLAFLRGDLVERWHWLTNAQLLDAVAAGQITPGPVFSTATFIGYLLGGVPGAAVATLGIFLPAFLYVAALAPVLPRLRRSPIAAAFLDGVNAGSLALLSLVSWQLGRSAIVDPTTALIAAGGTALLVRYGWGSVWLVLGGGLLGLVAR